METDILKDTYFCCYLKYPQEIIYICNIVSAKSNEEFGLPEPLEQ